MWLGNMWVVMLPLFVSAFGCLGLPDHRFGAGLPKNKRSQGCVEHHKKKKWQSHHRLSRAKTGFVAVFLHDGSPLGRESRETQGLCSFLIRERQKRIHNVQNYVRNAPAKAPRSLSTTGKNKEQINETGLFTFLEK